MKNSKLLILALFISLTAMAQVKTGGGPDNEGAYTEDMIMADAGMSDLLAAIRSNDAKCSPTPKLKNENVVQIYVKLTLLENMEISDQLCAEANKYLSCLHTKETSKIAKRILTTHKAIPYLSEQMNLKPEETAKILKYFANPKKKK